MILEIALSGSAISDEDLVDFLEEVELDLISDNWVHVYEVASSQNTSRGQIEAKLPNMDGYPVQVLYKGVLDDEAWNRDWA